MPYNNIQGMEFQSLNKLIRKAKTDNLIYLIIFITIYLPSLV